jgi:type IV pilus assembly protein PilW
MKNIAGFSLTELMIGLTLGIMLSIAVIGVYVTQVGSYKTNISQSTIQDAENTISALIIPIIRSAGFCGCASVTQAISNLNAGGPAPLGTLNTTATAVRGYDASAGTSITINQINATNDPSVTSWLPNLESSLQGKVQSVSDVLIVLGPLPGSSPIAVTSIPIGSVSMTLQNTSGLTTNQFAAVSDCLKATVFKITSIGGNDVSHAAGTGALANATDAFTTNYPSGSQFISITQTAFFVANDPSGESALVRATLNADGTWTIQSLIPDVQTMQVLYGIGSNGGPAQYVPASGVANWSQVYAIRLGFLLVGQSGSGSKTPTKYTIFGTTITVPSDNRLRHVFEITINLRNMNS